MACIEATYTMERSGDQALSNGPMKVYTTENSKETTHMASGRSYIRIEATMRANGPMVSPKIQMEHSSMPTGIASEERFTIQGKSMAKVFKHFLMAQVMMESFTMTRSKVMESSYSLINQSTRVDLPRTNLRALER